MRPGRRQAIIDTVREDFAMNYASRLFHRSSDKWGTADTKQQMFWVVVVAVVLLAVVRGGRFLGSRLYADPAATAQTASVELAASGTQQPAAPGQGELAATAAPVAVDSRRGEEAPATSADAPPVAVVSDVDGQTSEVIVVEGELVHDVVPPADAPGDAPAEDVAVSRPAVTPRSSPEVVARVLAALAGPSAGPDQTGTTDAPPLGAAALDSTAPDALRATDIGAAATPDQASEAAPAEDSSVAHILEQSVRADAEVSYPVAVPHDAAETSPAVTSGGESTPATESTAEGQDAALATEGAPSNTAEDLAPDEPAAGSSSDSSASGELVLVNPASSAGTIRYLVNGRSFSMPPGHSQHLGAGRDWRIHFHRGGDLADVELVLRSGSYEFAATEADGWQLQAVLVDEAKR